MKKTLALIVVISMLCLSGCAALNEEPSGVIYDDIDTVQNLLVQLENDPSMKDYLAETLVDGNENSKQNAVVDDEEQEVIIDSVVPAEINTSTDKPLYYTRLTEKQKQIYCYMKTAAEEMKDGYFSIGAVSSNEDRFTDIAISYRALICDNPEIFWLSGSYVVSTDGSAVAFSYDDKDIDYIMTPEQKIKAQEQLENVIDKIVSYANMLSSNFEKELFFHDWLCKNVKYVDSEKSSDYTIYGALVVGSAVCEGYSRAMQVLCDRVNIPCTVVYGSSFGDSHMWNVINPGDGWYHLDVTWDDDEKYNYVRHAYFNVNDDTILKDHEIFEQVVTGRKYSSGDEFNIYNYSCEFDTYNYFVKSKLIFTDDHSLNARIVKEAAKKDRDNIEVSYSGDDYVEFLNEINTALSNGYSKIWLKDFSYLGDSLVVWW